MSFRIKVDDTQIREILEGMNNKLEEIQHFVTMEVAEFILTEAKRLIREGHVENSKDPQGGAVSDRGYLAKESEVMESENGFVVGFKMPYAKFVHDGTVPHYPPFDPIYEWVKRNQLAADAPKGKKTKIEKQIAWKIINYIGENGTPPKPFLLQAMEIARVNMDSIVKNALRKLGL